MTDKVILLAVEAVRRGLPVQLDILEAVYGRKAACWIALLNKVDDSALTAAHDALRANEANRVRVVISVLPNA